MTRLLRANGNAGDQMETESYEILKSYLLKSIRDEKELDADLLLARALNLFEYVIEDNVEWHILSVLDDLEGQNLLLLEQNKYRLNS
ncbi:MAG: hypothetical protein EP332_03965 [Bacteroidetes bacterium]|nr:MAG: hypothetical protein EP332_03965 [Bacteroidota bacterium]